MVRIFERGNMVEINDDGILQALIPKRSFRAEPEKEGVVSLRDVEANRIFQYDVSLVTNQLGTPVGDLDAVLDYLTPWVGFNAASGGSGAGFAQQVDGFTDLVPGTQLDQLSYVENSQGTKWLPGPLGGTYFPSGVYRWNGSEWVSDRNAIAEQLETIIQGQNGGNNADLLIGQLFYDTNNDPQMGKLFQGQTYDWADNPKLKAKFDTQGHDFIVDNGLDFTIVNHNDFLRAGVANIGTHVDDTTAVNGLELTGPFSHRVGITGGPNNAWFADDGNSGQGGISSSDSETAPDHRMAYFGVYGDGATISVGPQGLTGPAGMNGADGIDGADGADGIQGPIGPQGIQGPAGADGLNGQDGIDGVNGTNGADGAQGIQGVAGNDGADGADGTDGLSAYEIALNEGFIGTEAQWLATLVGADGNDGAQGVQGIQGPAGPQGANGNDGADGLDGTNGTNGADGADGDSGYQVALNNGFIGTEADWLASLVGAQGPAGNDGVDGQDGAQGIQGPIGPIGPNGTDGADGNDGAQGIQGIQGIQGPAGNDGADGADGAIGPEGPQGPQGVPGINGLDGDSAYEVAVNGGFVGTEAQWLASLQGADGAAGTNGTNGVDGQDGADGAQGPQGIQGPIGLTGAAGADGQDGADGAQGIQGIQGIQGADGNDGADGAQGPIGLTGPAGADGADGAQGAQGIQGPAGNDGADGVDGAQGPQGIQGIQGIPGPVVPIDDLTNVNITTPVADDILAFDGTNWVNIKLKDHPLISAILSSFKVLQQFLGGSVSNAANQPFSIDLSDSPFDIGDTVELLDFEFRGDFSGANESVTVNGLTSDIVGGFASSDDDIWKPDTSTSITAIIVDIGGGVKGINLTFSPTVEVNFTPTGMTNWWEVRASIKIV